jgi:hypothetical protein
MVRTAPFLVEPLWIGARADKNGEVGISGLFFLILFLEEQKKNE